MQREEGFAEVGGRFEVGEEVEKEVVWIVFCEGGRGG